MDRYYLTRTEAGRWNVLDRFTGGPVEIGGVLLYNLDADDASDLLDLMIRQDRRFTERFNEIIARREKP